MREIRPSGSVRGVRRKPYPYRDSLQPLRSSAGSNYRRHKHRQTDGQDTGQQGRGRKWRMRNRRRREGTSVQLAAYVLIASDQGSTCGG